MSYRTEDAAHLAGLPAATLRTWELLYGLVPPGRDGDGRPLYADEDLEVIRGVRLLRDEGLSTREAILRVRRVAPPAEVDARLDRAREEVRDALLAFDRRAALEVLRALDGVAPQHLACRVLLPAVHDVGRLRERGEAMRVQEYAARAFARDRLVALLSALDGAGRGPEAVVAGLPGEEGELGVLEPAVCLGAAGWRILYLGPDLPAEGLAPVLARRRPPLFLTALDRPTSPEAFRALAEELRAAAPRETAVILCGGGIPAGAEGIEGVRIARGVEDALAAAEPLAAAFARRRERSRMAGRTRRRR